MIRWLRELRAGRAARRAYTEAQLRESAALLILATTADPAERGTALRQLDAAHTDMSYDYLHLFGDDGGQIDLMWSSWLYGALATVEEAVAVGDVRQFADWRVEGVGGSVLDQMTDHADLARRAGLLEDLYAAVYARVGDRAAQVLAELPSPGMVGWRTEAQRRAWERESAA